MSQPSFTFSLASHAPARYGPRLGSVSFRRRGQTTEATHIPTPGLLTATSRGVIPHLSRDHARGSAAIRWVNVPFETFLEQNPPVPTLQPGENPLHTFLGFTPGRHLLSMSARDPGDGREMPANGNGHVSVHSLRGVRKLAPADWRTYALACQPDVVFALSDTPFTAPPHSQKRLTKSIERSAAWLSQLLRRPSEAENNGASPLTVFVHMAGGVSLQARKAFSEGLVEGLNGNEAEAVKPLATLDEGTTGYAFDLVPLRLAVAAIDDPNPGPHTEAIIPLLQASLSPLPATKPRVVNSAGSPHEILQYIGGVGVDLFDARWAQHAADVGVALDFAFPVRLVEDTGTKHEIGHDVYDVTYAHDFGALAGTFRGGADADTTTTTPVCPCAACSPATPATRIFHGYDAPSVSGEPAVGASAPRAHYTRAYVHHLLHTHEMSAHALLAVHNLAVLDAFFAGVRAVIAGEHGPWEDEVRRFGAVYDERLGVLEKARGNWKEVDMARGKGRLAREKIRQEEGALED